MFGTSTRAQPRYELQGNSGWIYLRRKQACLRVPTLTPEANGDDYYYHLLMLYLPWRNETVDLLGSHATAKQSFVSNNDRLLVLGGDQASFAAEVERATCQLRALNQFGDTVYAPIAPGAAQRNMEMENEGAGPDPIYYNEALLADNHSSALTTDQQGVGEVNHLASNDYLADADDDRTVRAMGQRRMTDAEYHRKVDSLNESQRLAFQKVLNYTTARHEYQMHAVESPPEPLRLFITGGAGTGKSHVISVVHEHFERAQIGDGCACMLMAPTGVAAFNIGGLTIHKALNLPVEHGKRTAYRKLAGERLHGMRHLWKSVTTIIIDEISMVSYQTLNFVHQRLTEIKGTDDTEVLIGDLNVIAVGDFFQLPPVRDKFIFQEDNGYNPGSTHLWRDIFTMVELTINMRQMGDNTYSQVLGRIRTGQQTPDDIALRLLPLNVMVDEYNTHRLRQLAQASTVFEFKGEHSIVDSDSARESYGVVQHVDVPERLIPPDDNDCAGLPRSLKLAVGAQVMLRRNILCEDGL